MARDARPTVNGDTLPVVPYVAFRCPRCRRHKPATGKVRGRLRYHTCLACGQRYKSWEVGADQVVAFLPPVTGFTRG